MQCDSVLHDMYHQHADFLVALSCVDYFPRTSTKTWLFLFSNKQPLQGIYIIHIYIYHFYFAIYAYTSHNKAKRFNDCVYFIWFFVQVSLDHIQHSCKFHLPGGGGKFRDSPLRPPSPYLGLNSWDMQMEWIPKGSHPFFRGELWNFEGCMKW